jgi:hypothetical protein
LEAFFEWDSSGHKVSSRFKAQATVPSAVKVKGLSVPQQSGDYEWVPYDENHRTFEIEFLEFPMDMEFVKCALDYDKSVRGVLAVLNYDIDNEESQKTTINSMLEGFTEEDDEGYRGIAIHDPLERSLSLGFTANQKIADYNALDTAYLMNMYLPLGYSSVDLYSTDAAYIDYVNKVRASVSDSRIVPESNIENGMGVFSGMAKTRVLLRVKGDGVDMKHIAWRNCSNTEGDNSDSWDSRGCRLYQDVACSGEKMSYESDMEHLNMNAYSYYRYDGYSFSKTCYASNVKAAMMLDTTKWSVFLPDTIQEDDKLEAYADGLKRYCVASNFENNKLADCYDLYQQCMVSPDGNDCKNYLWLWCADRGWDLYGYEQCRSALVSRYYLGKVKSSVYKREIQSVCRYDWNSMCENWCERRRDGSVVCE